MSFQEQERALFDLLFDRSLRAEFCLDAVAALSSYELSAEEREDFREIRPDALELDAKMRRNFLLAHICRAFPVSFAIVSSLPDGLMLLKQLIDTQVMRANSLERPTVFATRLREALPAHAFDSQSEQPLVIAILEAEMAMAITAASLKKEIIEGSYTAPVAQRIDDAWPGTAIRLAPHVGAAVIPQSYAELKKAFCAFGDTELWSGLQKNPVSKTQRSRILKNEVPRLLVIRARMDHMSLCDPGVEFNTAELSDGFAPLFQHVNGSMSVTQILDHLQQAGAPEQILTGVKAGFLQLLKSGMLEFAAP